MIDGNRINDLESIFEEFQTEFKAFSYQEVKKRQKNFLSLLEEHFKEIEELAMKDGIKNVASESLEIARFVWNPEIEWNIAYMPELTPVGAKDSASVYGTIVKLYLSLKTSLNDLVDQYRTILQSISQAIPNRLIKCKDEAFLYEFYERIFQYIEEQDQQEIKKFIERRFDVEFLEYDERYSESGYFDIHHAYGETGTTGMALINKKDGSLIHKGDYVISIPKSE